MNKFKNIVYILLFISFPFAANAQYAEDGLKFTQQFLRGTARYMSIGGAETSLGGDLGALSGNPAGVGMFRKSDIGLSLQYNNNSASASYLSNPEQKSSVNNFKLSNLSVALPVYVNREKINEICNEWIGVTLGVGYNRTNDLYSEYSFGGRNPNNSITQSFAQRASKIGVQNEDLPDDLGFAYDNYLIDEETTNPVTGKILYVPISTGNVNQRLQNNYKGSQNETNIVLAANYGNKLYFGASLKFTNQNYDSENYFKEDGINSIFQNPSESVVMLNQFQKQSVDGSGFTGKIGAIFRPLDEVRLGGSIEFPTSWKMKEDYSYDLNSTTVNGTFYEPNSPSTSYFEYTLTTPFRYSLGASYFIGKMAFISADVEFIDYTALKMKSSDFDTDQNFKDDVNAFYRSVVNIHLGGEVKLDQLSLRAGFANYGNPFSDNSANDGKRNFYTGGVGYRINNFYIDAAYINSSYKTTLRPYLLDDFSEPVLNVKQRTNSVVLTIGTRF
ncbi:OmpP1/FadL family transporter [Solitalea lacus]|uniref:OmpP1/FadL family transporter n=1 Tax=Solitalea lacus TaxID=2911172 RepID=UPI001EDA17E9|nr:outer membrane protein transport protein [Solitalea lacus]UKJ05994.1 outer membrane protein transport protein [Solitalea lacus]